MIDRDFWKNRKVFVTGHTGFKGSWLCIWLGILGAKVCGYALDPPTRPSLFEEASVKEILHNSIINDIRKKNILADAISEFGPEIVFHLTAQPIVRDSYLYPLETYETNIMGTAYLLDAARKSDSIKVITVITTDKVYENREWVWGYREDDSLGGYDPYSSSKACAEFITSAYRNSFFSQKEYGKSHAVAIATARAGNVIGGGDWAKDRLVPDCMRAFIAQEKIVLRNPHSIRPWQHVLEPLLGYLMLAQGLFDKGAAFSGAWNFGPEDSDSKPVEWIVNYLCRRWGTNAGYAVDPHPQPHESNYLKLDCSKSKSILGWVPRWNLENALDKVVDWFNGYAGKKNVLEISRQQIDEFYTHSTNCQ